MHEQNLSEIEIDEEQQEDPFYCINDNENNLSKKLERRRRIEDILEEKRLKEEFDDF